MADETPDQPSTKPLDTAFYVLMAVAVAAVAFLAWDAFSNGQATEVAARLIRQVRPTPGTVTRLRSVEDDGTERSG